MIEWKEYTVQDLIDLNMIEEPMDGNHGGIHPKTTDYVPVGVPFIMANNLVDGGVDLENCSFITEEQANNLRKGFAHPGDVLLTHKATIGRTAIVPDKYPVIILTPQVTYYRIKKDINKRYLKYYFDSPGFQNTLSSWANSGSTRAYLGITAQHKLPVVLPSLEIQDKIAAILSAIDDKIQNNKQINRNLQEQLDSIYCNRFKKNINGILADLCDYSKTRVDINSLTTETYYSTENMLPNKGGATIAAGLPTTEKTPACIKGNVLISNIRPYFKKIVYCHDDAGCSADVLCFVAKRKELSTYIYSTLYTDQFFEYMVAGSKGTKMPRGDKQQIMKYPVHVPDSTELEEFREIAENILKIIAKNNVENKKLYQLRDSLLSKLMSGELNVADLDI